MCGNGLAINAFTVITDLYFYRRVSISISFHIIGQVVFLFISLMCVNQANPRVKVTAEIQKHDTDVTDV